MTILLAGVIVATALVAVLAPFLRPRPAVMPAPAAPDGEGASGRDLVAELTRARDAKRGALEDLLALETDFKTGTLAEADYLELKRQDEERALAFIARVDALEAALGPAAVAAVGLGAAAQAGASAQAGAAESLPAGEKPSAPHSPAIMALGAVVLLVAGIGAGYLVATRGSADPISQAAGGGQPAMSGPVVAMVREYRARLEANPKDVEALVGLAQLNLQRRDVTQAIDHFKRALAVDSGHPEALTGLGMILAEAGDFTEALATFDRALKRDPNHLQALWWKAQVQLYALKNYRAAVPTLERALALLPPSPSPERTRVAEALGEARAGAAGPRAPSTPAAR